MDLGIDRYCRRYKHYITIHIFNKHGTLIIYFRLLSAAGLAVPPQCPSCVFLPTQRFYNFMLTPWICRCGPAVSSPVPWTLPNASRCRGPYQMLADAVDLPLDCRCREPAETDKFTSKSEYTPTSKSLKKAAPENFTWVYL